MHRKWIFCSLFALLVTASALPAAANAGPNLIADFYPATIHGSAAYGNEVITTEGGKVECTTSYHAVLNAPSAVLPLAPTYTACAAFGFVEASMTGCKMKITASSTTSSTYHFTGTCTIITSTCHITISPQGPLSAVSLTNVGSDITFQKNVVNNSYTVVKDGYLCPFSGTGAKAGATYKQGSAITFDAVNPATASISVS